MSKRTGAIVILPAGGAGGGWLVSWPEPAAAGRLKENYQRAAHAEGILRLVAHALRVNGLAVPELVNLPEGAYPPRPLGAEEVRHARPIHVARHDGGLAGEAAKPLRQK